MTRHPMILKACLLPVVLLTAHCGREKDPASAVGNGGEAKLSKVQEDRSPAQTVPPEIAAGKHRHRTALEAKDFKRGFEIVRELKAAGHFREASDAMGETLARMEFPGMPVAKAVGIIGEPDVKSEQEMVYRFDNGYSGSLWALKLEGDTVSGFERRGID